MKVLRRDWSFNNRLKAENWPAEADQLFHFDCEGNSATFYERMLSWD